MSVSAEEKLLFLQSIPFSIEANADIQQKLHNLLMLDTNGGKLFKYRKYDKYALDCIKQGTIFCATPDKFNDPFDCKIGYTFQSLYEAKYGTELDRIARVIDKYALIMNGTLSLKDCATEEQRIIAKLLENKRLSEFFLYAKQISPTGTEANEIISQNAFVITDLLTPFMNDSAYAPELGILKDVFTQFCQKINPQDILTLSECEGSISNLAKANGITADADEIGLVFLLNRLMAPDNEKSVQSVDKILRKSDNKIAKKIKQCFRIGCLATDYKNRLMWSHYADSHKGFCIEYDFSGTDPYTLDHLPLPIYYSKERPLIPWKTMIDNTPENLNEASRQLMTGLLTKDSAWSYENEWRILIPGNADPLLKMPAISCVYLGADITKGHAKNIIEIANKHGIPVKQMTVDRGAFELHAETINSSGIF